MYRFARATFNRTFKKSVLSRNFGAGGHHGPHVSEVHAKVGKASLIVCYLWIMYKFKEDKGQIFGLYRPWLHEHAHEHFHYVEGDSLSETPTLLEDEYEFVEEEFGEGN